MLCSLHCAPKALKNFPFASVELLIVVTGESHGSEGPLCFPGLQGKTFANTTDMIFTLKGAVDFPWFSVKTCFSYASAYAQIL